MKPAIEIEEDKWIKKYEEHFGIRYVFDWMDDKPKNTEESIEWIKKALETDTPVYRRSLAIPWDPEKMKDIVL